MDISIGEGRVPTKRAPGHMQITVKTYTAGPTPLSQSAGRRARDVVNYFERFDPPTVATQFDASVHLETNYDDGAHATNASLTIGAGVARSTEVIGHELGHLFSARMTDAHRFPNRDHLDVDTLEEGWADIFGAAAAHAAGARRSSNWIFGESALSRDAAPNGYVRDLEHPVVGNIDELGVYLHRTPKREIDSHVIGGIVTRAAALAARTLGQGATGDLFTDAFAHDRIPRRAATGRRDSFDLAAASIANQLPLRTRVLQDARDAALATLDATARRFGRDTSEFDAVRDAWRAVGVDVRWRPRKDAATAS